jgi:uncharacterized membrane protein YcfT
MSVSPALDKTGRTLGSEENMRVEETTRERVAWVDYAKGICILLVVLMHSTLGVEKAAGQLSWLHGFIEWAKPFRMPDFFLISGLFLAQRIDKPWRSFLDSKVLHFAYFYLLWMTILFVVKSGLLTGTLSPGQALRLWATGFIEPNAAVWFIYMLPLFMLALKLTRNIPPALIFALAAVLEALPIDTGWTVIDEFSGRSVYVFVGYWLAGPVFAFARFVGTLPLPTALTGFAAWLAVNTLGVWSGYAAMPGISLVLGLLGACAVVTCGVLLSKLKLADSLRYCGENSIVIYLAFSIFMAAARVILLRFGVPADLGSVALLCTVAGVIGPLALYWAVRGTHLAFLFKRPAWAHLRPKTTLPQNRQRNR